jgi:hypothetical protein
MTTQTDLKNVREFIYQSIKDSLWINHKTETQIKAEIEQSVFMIDNEIRVSGEHGNDFSLYFVNYYEGLQFADKFMDSFKQVTKGCWLLEWFNSAYMVAYKQ